MESPDTITAGLATLALGRTQSARAFEFILPRLGVGDRRLAYASAAAIGNFNLRQASVLALVKRSVREGMPVSAAAIVAALQAEALATTDIVAALAEPRTSRSLKLRLISVLGQIPAELAVPVLCELISSHEIEAEYGAELVAALVRHESAATSEIVGLLRDESTRRVGLRILEAMQEPRGLLSVLRSVSPFLESDEALRTGLREKGDQLLGPLLDIIYENWDLDTLRLLWQLSEVVEEQSTGTSPASL
jgi:hypothetical protein